VAFTAGILRLMNNQELEGVVAHELGHVKNRDILTSSIAATVAAAITWLARMAFWFGGSSRDDEDRNPWAGLLMMILAPIAALVIQMAISRTREYAADETSAKVTHNPNELISALGKLETWSQRIPLADATPSTAHLFIIKPFSGRGLMNLFSTHPATEDRIRRLEQMKYAR
jgi:heat shock protein HtpX